MIIFDLFVGNIYLFLTKKFHRNKSDAKFSAICFLSLYSTFFLLGLISTVGIINNNTISKYCLDMDFGFIFICSIVFLIVWSIRYYRFVRIEDMLDKFSKINKKHLSVCIYCLYILIPIFSFVSYRLYLFGFV